METIRRWIVSIAVMFVFGYLSIGDALAQNAKHNYRTNVSTYNETILSASSPFEDITESAIAVDEAGIEQALQVYDAQASKGRGYSPRNKARRVEGFGCRY